MTQTLYTWKQVAAHNSESDMWIVINDKVYNVTDYANQHPGGPIVLINKSGKNASLAFEQASHSVNARQNVMPRYCIGKIDHNSEIEEWQKEAASSAPNVFLTVGVVLAILIAIYYMAA